MSKKSVCLAISKMSEAAGVKVLENDGKVKCATAHDFRRSFGSRWAKRVMPAVLMRLMRHKTTAVTMTFYATQDSDSVAEAALRAISSDSGQKSVDFPQKIKG